MTSIGGMTLFRAGQRTNFTVLINGFRTTRTTYLDQSWREKNRLTVNPNTFGPLTNLPDFSYKDGRPVPYGAGQMRRIDRHREYAKKIAKLVDEIDHAVARHDRLQNEDKEKRQKIIDSKLKPKGELLLKSNKDS